MSSPSENSGSVGAVVKASSAAIYAFFLFYLDMVVQAGMIIAIYTLSPIFYLCGRPWRDVNDFVYDFHERFIIFISMTLRGVRLRFYGDYEKVMGKKENVLVICNHQVEADYFVMASAFEKTGSLPRLRHVLKESLIWLPYVGAFLINHGSFFINRSKLNWNRFETNASELAACESDTSVLIYPEGTTWNNGLEVPGVFERSDALARSCDREPFQYVMFPKHKGFYRLLTNLRHRMDAVYDLTFGYSSTRGPEGPLPAPGMIEFMNGDCPEVHLHLRRIDIKDVPVSETDVRNFLIERFAEKNELMDAFFKTGRFPTQSFEAPAQNTFHTAQSATALVAASVLGVTSYGWNILPWYLGVPMLVSYAHVAHHMYSY